MGVKNMDCYKYGSLARKEPNLTPHNFICDFPFVKKSKILIELFFAITTSLPHSHQI